MLSIINPYAIASEKIIDSKSDEYHIYYINETEDEYYFELECRTNPFLPKIELVLCKDVTSDTQNYFLYCREDLKINLELSPKGIKNRQIVARTFERLIDSLCVSYPHYKENEI